LQLRADSEVTHVGPLPQGGYRVEVREGRHPLRRRKLAFTSRNVIFAGGVLGTVDLLLRLKNDPRGLPELSDRLGAGVRTNSEALIGVMTPDRSVDLSKGIAIGSILQTDEHSHIEPVRYSAGSGFFRLLIAPHVGGVSWASRFVGLIKISLRHPIRVLQALTVRDFAKQTAILLYMRALEGTLRLRRRFGRLSTVLEGTQPPTASMPEATELAHRFAAHADGIPMSLVTETLLNIPTTAHILGGCCMGDSPETGVIDADHKVFGYEGLYVIDGSAVSANPGVNPALTIAALAERALTRIPPVDRAGESPAE
jgi:cholesterol oxidase